MATPVWIMRVHGREMLQGAWSGEPIDVPKDWVVCLYPKERSAEAGAWLIENVGDIDVWTLSLPVTMLPSRSHDVMGALWNISAASIPCVAGEEYSMSAVCRTGGQVIAEAISARSLASHIVARWSAAPVGWSVVRSATDRVLFARNEV